MVDLLLQRFISSLARLNISFQEERLRLQIEEAVSKQRTAEQV
jgi:hypothetical protein